MKKIYLVLLTMILSSSIFAQTNTPAKVDVILKTNGDEMKGKITKITDNDVQFIYSGETLEYTIKKSEILKITHSSGRVEMITQPVQPVQESQKKEAAVNSPPVDHHNKIAILPFTYLLDRQAGSEEIGYKAQEDTYAYLAQHAAGYTILDTRTTNALLIKAGITKDKMRGFTMKEICDILGVEYLVDGTVTQNKGYQTAYSGDNSNTNVNRDGKDKVKDVNSSSSTYSNSAQRYEVSVSINIYMDTNASIYNQTHKAFFTNLDGDYSSPLEYLLKRSPLYRN